MLNESIKFAVMNKMVYAFGCMLVLACNQTEKKDAAAVPSATSSPKETPVVTTADQVPLYRDSVRQEPVAEYRVKTDDPLNDWYFQVQLYETPKTFHYLIKLQYEEIRGEDTLKLPNFGKLPEPVIRKGPEQYSCIIGFMDKDSQFREYKKVYVENEQLKITALKHYGISRSRAE